MASLRSLPNSPYWIACVTLGKGRRTQKSTGIVRSERTRTKALALAEKWERMALDENPQSKLTNRELVTEHLIKATRDAEKGVFTQSTAQKCLDTILEASGQSPLKNDTVKEFLEKWLEGKQLSKNRRTWESYRKTCSYFLACIGDKANQSLQSLTTKDIEKFRHARLREKASSVTIGLDLKIIRSALSTARRQGYVSVNVAEGCDIPRAESLSRVVFTPAEVACLLGVATNEWKTAIMLGFYVGCRIGDAVSMTWENIDLDAKIITYIAQKTKKHTTVPMHTDLFDYLFALADDDQGGHLCPSLVAKKASGRSGLSAEFIKLMKEANVDTCPITRPNGRIFLQKTFHALRTTFSSMMANAGVADEIRMKLTGHADKRVHARYTQLQIDPLKKAIGKLPTLKTKKS